MKRSCNYKSPAKIKRDTRRLLAHLFKTIHMKAVLPPTMKPTLGISPALLTNFPDPCILCHQPQCEYDLRHSQYFALKLFLEEQLESTWKKKPPDDASGVMVATYKEPIEASSKF